MGATGGNNEGSRRNDHKSRTHRLRARDFYHGQISREDTTQVLKADGDFLLRKTQSSDATKLALSVFWQGRVRHFVVQEAGKHVFFEADGHHEEDVEQLVKWHQKNAKPVTSASGVLLKNAICREDWVLTHESIELERRIGSGQFGEVYAGKWKQFRGLKHEVAIKTLREGDVVENQKSFLAEARLMRQLRHANVVRIYGVAVYEQPLMIVMELCSNGSLLKHLRSTKATTELKMKWTLEAARGLQYIASNGCIHRDIAARNCLLGDKLTLKIADFGLTLKQANVQMENLGKVPVKWLARETLELGVYSHKTDVWSYGILCWEIYSNGAEPYPGMSNVQARARILLEGYRMEIPKDVPSQIAALIRDCWTDDPQKRPSFDDVLKRLTSG